jgi:ribosomal protein S18 acetylase RimI-like enzyme
LSNNIILYKTNTAVTTDIILHLKTCNNEFIPKLDTRVNLEEYSQKINQNAVTFEAWNKLELIGLIAAYFNQEKCGFISNVSVVKNHSGIGIASKLLLMCIEYAKSNKFNTLRLEVNKENNPAIYFYRKYNFIEIEKTIDSLIMHLKLK